MPPPATIAMTTWSTSHPGSAGERPDDMAAARPPRPRPPSPSPRPPSRRGPAGRREVHRRRASDSRPNVTRTSGSVAAWAASEIPGPPPASPGPARRATPDPAPSGVAQQQAGRRGDREAEPGVADHGGFGEQHQARGHASAAAAAPPGRSRGRRAPRPPSPPPARRTATPPPRRRTRRSSRRTPTPRSRRGALGGRPSRARRRSRCSSPRSRRRGSRRRWRSRRPGRGPPAREGRRGCPRPGPASGSGRARCSASPAASRATWRVSPRAARRSPAGAPEAARSAGPPQVLAVRVVVGRGLEPAAHLHDRPDAATGYAGGGRDPDRSRVDEQVEARDLVPSRGDPVRLTMARHGPAPSGSGRRHR